MVSEKKKQVVSEVGKEIEDYSVIGILNMFKLPSSQLDEIRQRLRDEAKIKMVKKRLIKLILEGSRLKGIGKLSEYIQGQPAFLLSKADPFKLARKISKSKSSAAAKPGDIAPKDIAVKAGLTSLSAGPVIGELQRAKIPAGVEGEKIIVKEDTLVAKEGDIISKELAGVLSKLGIKPMEIGLNLLAVWEDGMIYKKELLFRDPQEYVAQLKQAYANAFNLSLNAGYFTKDNIALLLSKAHAEARALADSADILTEESAPKHIAKAASHAKALKDKLGIEEVKEQEPEPKKEKKPEAEKREPQKEKAEPEKKEEPKPEEKKPKKEAKQAEETKKEKPAKRGSKEKPKKQSKRSLGKGKKKKTKTKKKKS